MNGINFYGENQNNGQNKSINLKKNSVLNLSKERLNKVLFGLGWDLGINGSTYDLDASAFLLDRFNQCPDSSYAILYAEGHEKGYGVSYGGDNRTGAGDGDDETIDVHLSEVPKNIEKIVFVTSIYNAIGKKQNFGQVRNAFIRLVNIETNQEIAKYSLTEDYSTCQSVIMGALERTNNDWNFRAIGEGIQGELEAVIGRFGLSSE